MTFSFRLASTVYQTYVASDEASESFAGLKRVHNQMPYFMLKAALRITNPVTMIRSTNILCLLLAFCVNMFSRCDGLVSCHTVRWEELASKVSTHLLHSPYFNKIHLQDVYEFVDRRSQDPRGRNSDRY